jgi:heme A synthase
VRLRLPDRQVRVPRFSSVRNSATMAKEHSHYPVAIYVLTVVCALGLASVALGIADGWVLIAAGAAAITASLTRLHVVLARRRAGAGLRPLPLGGRTLPKRRS